MIVGAGFTGALTLVNLLRRELPEEFRIAIIERRPAGEFGLGLAYSTVEDTHYLNVQSGNMSALADERTHLVQYLQKNVDADAKWSTFITRHVYGRYIRDTMATACDDAERRAITVDTIRTDVTDIEVADGEYILRSGDKVVASASNVILAIGNPKPAIPHVVARTLAGNSALIADPWDRAQFESVSSGDDVLFIGSGLTMVDKALELAAKGHTGRLIAVSRHGLLPQSHKREMLIDGYPEIDGIKGDLSVRSAVREVRARIKQAADWRLVIDALRPFTNAWWQGLNSAEKLRFLRHVQPYWDTFRHRMAPEVGAEIEHMVNESKLEIVAGRIVSCLPESSKIAVTVHHRGTDTVEKFLVDKVVNCTGPSNKLAGVNEPLVSALLSKGLITANELGAGILIDDQFRAVGRDGKANTHLRVVGPLLRGNFFETIAVPELRQQARAVSELIYKEVADAKVRLS